MDQPFATLVAGIAAAAGSTAVGLWAVRGASRNTRLTLENQRQLILDERAANARKEFAEDLATWLAGDIERVQLWFDKPGSRKRTMKQPPDELIGRALILDPAIAEHLKRMRLSAIREDSVVKQQDQGGALFEESIGAERRAWQDARDAVLLWLRRLYGDVEPV